MVLETGHQTWSVTKDTREQNCAIFIAVTPEDVVRSPDHKCMSKSLERQGQR